MRHTDGAVRAALGSAVDRVRLEIAMQVDDIAAVLAGRLPRHDINEPS